VLVGLMPLLPFVATTMTVDSGFPLSAYATAVAFFGVGALKGWVLRRSILWTGIVTLAIGGTAAVLAYSAGYILRRMYVA
jgi:VIT1/CCC1 family predicted Fe2+/Mn2+ transporter